MVVSARPLPVENLQPAQMTVAGVPGVDAGSNPAVAPWLRPRLLQFLLDQFSGFGSKFGAHEDLFVSWSGFKSNVQKELAASFFRVRLWTQKELLEQLLAHYEQLDEDLRAELPLKRIWTVAAQDEE
jgi:hypothetical protein